MSPDPALLTAESDGHEMATSSSAENMKAAEEAATSGALPSTPSVEMEMDGTYTKLYMKGEVRFEPKLGIPNYRSWRRDAKMMLKARGLWEIVSGLVLPPDPKTRPKDFRMWKDDDRNAMKTVYLNWEMDQEKNFRHCTTSYQIWNCLADVHGVTAEAHFNYLMMNFWNYKTSRNKNVDQTVTFLTDIMEEVQIIDPEVEFSDITIATQLFSAMKQSQCWLLENLVFNLPLPKFQEAI